MSKLLSFEALLVLDAIERRGSFAAASEELGRAPSSLSYQVQKLEQDLDLVIFDRSGHRAVFTKAGLLLLQRGRALLAAADEMVADASALAHGWELELTIAYDSLITLDRLLPLVEQLAKHSKTKLKLKEEALAGTWEALSHDRADIILASSQTLSPQDVKMQPIGMIDVVWVAHPDHPIHREQHPLDPSVRKQYRSIAVADTARSLPPITHNILDDQPLLTLSSMHDKLVALKAGLGVATLPYAYAKEAVEAGELKIIGDNVANEVEIVMAWHRGQMGKAKTWCIQHLPKIFNVDV